MKYIWYYYSRKGETHMENENKTLKYNANQKEALKMVSLAEE